jgi:RNA polymerase sigma-70 factor (ECF subfamily)
MGADQAAREQPGPGLTARIIPDLDAEARAAIAAGDHRRALTLCAQRHGIALGRLCLALVGSQSEADDLVQETLLDAHAVFASYRAEGSLRAWLFAIARRKCARHLERRTQHSAHLKLVQNAEHDPAAVDLLIAHEQAASARAALLEIRPSEREALVLRFLGELSFQEVAETCGIDEVAARKRVSRGLQRLREILARSSK